MTTIFRNLVLAGAATVSLSSVAAAETIGIATLPVGAILHLQAQIIGKVVQQKTDLQARVIPLAGTSETMASVQNQEAEFTLGDVDNMSDAVHGTNQFSKLKPMKDLRVVLKLQEFPIGIMVANKGPIKTMEDLKGKRYPIGWQAFPNGIPLTEGIFAANKLTLKDIAGVNVSGLIPAADDLKSGKLDATLIALPAPKVREVDAALDGGVRFLSVDKSAEALARVKKIRPEYGLMTVNPGLWPGVFGPTNVLATYTVITTSSKVADAIVYKFLKALAENKAELVKGSPQFGSFSPDAKMAQPFSTVQYHPGALKYFKEKGFPAPK